jgi:hypothetical protein
MRIRTNRTNITNKTNGPARHLPSRALQWQAGRKRSGEAGGTNSTNVFYNHESPKSLSSTPYVYPVECLCFSIQLGLSAGIVKAIDDL